jgi:integrase
VSTNLTFKYVENLKSQGRYTDALVPGLHLWVKSNLKKYWIFRYSQNRKQQNISLGPYPKVSIAEARLKAQEFRNQIDSGINPLTERQKQKFQTLGLQAKRIVFRAFAEECIKTKRAEWTNQKHGDQWEYTLKEFAYPIVGEKYLDEISTEDILAILSPIWANKTETASRLRGRLEWILASATTRKLRTGTNPALWRGHLQTILPAPNKVKKVQHHKALPYRRVPQLISDLSGMTTVGALALEFTILNASRTGEVIGGLRSEVNNDIWIIPSSRMKAKKEHRVPLSARSLEILAIARAMDNNSEYLFSINGKPISNMAMSMALRRANADATVHGFRSSFRDWVSEETNHPSEVAEMALAHTISNKVEAAYRRRDLLEKRRLLMNEWASYCSTSLQTNVTQLKAA